MVLRQEESSIRINYMALSRFLMMKGTIIGGNSRITRGKVLEQKSGPMVKGILDNTLRVINMAMEFSDGQMEDCIKDNINKIKEKVTHITGGQMAMNIMDSGRIICSAEKE